ncbi:MAG: glycine cleavage system aminomethyltransferase GcvT [Planctomycetota bacterium]|nr:MAG: glycine cleavage system aminomethyltransferase GcvT [Planctomycetota bacterium]
MLTTPLYEAHKRIGARLIDFGGWEMPVMYRGIQEEHVYTRTASSIFDVSHMGRLYFTGPDTEALLQHVCTRNVSKLKVGRSGYSHICNEQGGILDDVIVSRYEDKWLMVCNAGNREKIVAHLKQHMQGRNVKMDDTTTQSVMVAIQGPATMDLFARHMPIKVGEVARYGFVSGSYMGQKYSVFRSGYTGEDGLEVILSAGTGVLVWDYLTQDGGQDRVTIKPAGLGARDTLRLEAGMPLYGHELNESVDPLSAGCAWCVDLEKEFIGASVLRKIAAEGPRRKLTGLVLEGKRIARQGAKVFTGETEAGIVTSGTLSPTLEKSIAIAYIDSARLASGDKLSVEIKDQRIGAAVVPLPFYKRGS